MMTFIASFSGISLAVLLMALGVILHSRPLKHGCGGQNHCKCKSKSKSKCQGNNEKIEKFTDKEIISLQQFSIKNAKMQE